MLNFLVAILAIMLVLFGWIAVQTWARNFSARHPELGPHREEGAGCGSGQCGCGGQQRCSRKGE